MQELDWQFIVKKHANLVWCTAYRLLGDQSDTEDCFQETFISALKTAQQQRIWNISALLVHLATRRAIDILRRRCSRIQVDINNIDTAVLRSRNPGPLQDSQNSELKGKLLQALTKLSSQQAEAFCMRYLSDMSQKEIGKKLCITTNAAGVLLHRARQRLKEIFEKQDTQ